MLSPNQEKALRTRNHPTRNSMPIQNLVSQGRPRRNVILDGSRTSVTAATSRGTDPLRSYLGDTTLKNQKEMRDNLINRRILKNTLVGKMHTT
jgi:hypothetical protein